MLCVSLKILGMHGPEQFGTFKRTLQQGHMSAIAKFFFNAWLTNVKKHIWHDTTQQIFTVTSLWSSLFRQIVVLFPNASRYWPSEDSSL